MPIREIMTFSIGALATLFIMNGPLHFKQAIRETQAQILREAGRTNNWGNPSIFQQKHHLKNRGSKPGGVLPAMNEAEWQ